MVVDDRIARAGGPGETVGRVVEVGLHRPGGVHGPLHGLVALRRVALVPVQEGWSLDDAGRDDVVFPGTVVLHQPQHRALPVNAVLGGGQAGHGRIVLAADHDPRGSAGAQSGPHLQVAGRVPHLEDAVLVVEHHRGQPDVVALPGALGPDDGVVGEP